jgi:hypothetical protein
MTTVTAQRPLTRAAPPPWRMAHTFPPCVGLLLLAAAALKVYQFMGDAPQAPGWLPAWALGIVIPFETWLGICLLLGRAQRASWIAATAFFSLGALASTYAAWSGFVSCGCYGGVRVPPALSGMVNCAMATAFVWLYPRRAGFRPWRGWALLRAVGTGMHVCIAGLLLLIASHAVPGGAGPASQRTGLADGLEGWVGKPFPDIELTGIAGAISRGTWLALLYDPRCQSCRDALRACAAMVRSSDDDEAPKLAVLSLARGARDAAIDAQGSVLVGTLPDHLERTLPFPSGVLVVDGRVLAVWPGSIPSNWDSVIHAVTVSPTADRVGKEMIR